ncbi:DNA-binding protein [Pasteurellaceae bacterium Pebbles2]|nr:DNA-binding protein [Pasteurellaceae bacterium Pebbles2]
MDTQINPLEQQISLGEQFRQARLALNLSLEEVSSKINLRPAILESIEKNELVHKNIPAIFMKGYVRNYGKFLKLPEALWADEAVSFGEMPKNDLSKNARTKKAVNPHASHGRWVGVLTALVLIAAVGMTALWWWENYQQSNSERDNLVQNYVKTEEQHKNVSQNSTETVLDAPAANSTTSTDVATSSSETAEKTAQAMLMQHSGDKGAESQTTENQVSEQNSTQSAVQNSAENSTENVTQSNEPAAVATGDLQIEITAATSWISVRDSKRKNLAQKEYKQGEILTFDGQGPYSLTIGAPSNVKITYKGEAYPLKIDGRVARIKLQ